MLGLTILNQETFKLDDIYKICLFQGINNPTIEYLQENAMYPMDKEPSEIGLMEMGDYRSDVRWETFPTLAEPNPIIESVNTVGMGTIADGTYTEPVMTPEDVEKEATLYWRSFSAGRSTSIFEYRYPGSPPHEELNRFNTIIIYGFRDNKPFILSFGYLNNDIEFSQIRSIILKVNVDNQTSSNVISTSLYAWYQDHAKGTPNLIAMHGNLEGKVTDRINTENSLNKYITNREKLKLSMDSAENALSIDDETKKLTYTELGVSTDYRYELNANIDILAIKQGLIASGIPVAATDAEFIKNTTLTFDRTFGAVIICYGANYLVASPTGYNKKGVIYYIRDYISGISKDYQLVNPLECVFKFYENAILVQNSNTSFIFTPTTIVDSLTIDGKQYAGYATTDTNYGSNPNIVVLPCFDLGNLLYYKSEGLFKCPSNFINSYPQSTFTNSVDLRYQFESATNLLQLESEYRGEACLFNSISALGVSLGLQDAGIIYDCEEANSLVFVPFTPNLTESIRWEVPKLTGNCKYFMNNKVLYCIKTISESEIEVYNCELGIDKQFKLIKTSTKSYMSSRGIIIEA